MCWIVFHGMKKKGRAWKSFRGELERSQSKRKEKKVTGEKIDPTAGLSHRTDERKTRGNTQGSRGFFDVTLTKTTPLISGRRETGAE